MNCQSKIELALSHLSGIIGASVSYETKLREELEKKEKRSEHFEHLAKPHPCMGGEAVGRALELCPELRIVGIAGPGDTLATDYALDTFELVKRTYPELLSCLSTNGLQLPEKAERIAEIGLDTITVTVNAVDPEIQKEICSYIIWNGKKIEGLKGAKILIENQLKGIKAVADAGVVVKINSVLIPGINDHHIVEVARITSELGFVS